jgi:uncharacterized protein (TIGR02171 family)
LPYQLKWETMKPVVILGTLFFLAAFFACQPDLTVKPENLPPPGMKKIESKGKSFHQGWNDPRAVFDEKPGMIASFTYDYWIDSTEVTQRYFFDLTGRRPVSEASPYGAGDRYPVYYVTWFDAVLFCNARSRAENLDTVYIYSGRRETASGMVYDLIGLRGDYAHDGYRLPTEAEWEYAASGGQDDQPFDGPDDSTAAREQAWYLDNASNSAHPVGKKLPNAFNLYDMAGNVFEWTNDWKGMYDGQSISNSLGALQPDGDNEKVIKGGAYNLSLRYLRPSGRSATYATTLSSANEYVGFRCARAVIEQGNYLGIGPIDFVPNPVVVTATNADVRAFTGTSASRLVFVNVTGPNRTLCYIDFSRTFPYVIEYLDDKKVCMPVISPDGRHVAWCSANEGQFGPSKIYIRALDSLGTLITVLPADTAYIPRWWMDRSTGDTCIIYTNSAVANSSPIWKSSKTVVQKISDGIPVGSPWVITENGGYHDGRSVDGRFLITAYDRLMVRDLQAGTERQIFMAPENGKDSTGSAQVCNASLSPDTGINAQCLFLDFGSPVKSTITGTSYGIHEIMFGSSLEGTITDFLHCPAGEESWDFCEWSNQSGYAVSSVRNGAGQAHAVHIVKLSSLATLPVVAGTELHHPGWWIREVLDNPFNFALDSLGCYDDPHVDGVQGLFAFMMHYFWNRAGSLDLLFAGNSQVIFGVDCTRFNNLKTGKIAFNNCGLTVISTLINKYIFTHAPKVRLIGINMPTYFFNRPGGEVESTWWDRTIGASKGLAYDSSHNFWRDSIPDGFYQMAARASFPERTDLDTFGLALYDCQGWGGENPDLEGSTEWTVQDTNFRNNIELLKSIIQDLSARKVHLLVINFPESPYYRTTDHYTRFGPSWETGKAMIEQVKALESVYPYFHVYDAYNDGNHDYTDADARDENHLCPTGAAKLSARLDSLIKTIFDK